MRVDPSDSISSCGQSPPEEEEKEPREEVVLLDRCPCRWMYPGATTFAVMPRDPTSLDTDFEKAMIPAFEAA